MKCSTLSTMAFHDMGFPRHAARHSDSSSGRRHCNFSFNDETNGVYTDGGASGLSSLHPSSRVPYPRPTVESTSFNARYRLLLFTQRGCVARSIPDRRRETSRAFVRGFWGVGI